MFAESITKEEVAELPLMTFSGEIQVISNDIGYWEAISYLKKCSVLGFDTETKPTFKKYTYNPVALLQLADDQRAFLFRLNKIGLPPSLAEILADNNIIKAGVAIHDDILALQKRKVFLPAGFVELQKYVGNFNIKNIGLKSIAAIVLNIRISKHQQTTNWENDQLTLAQANYAATDAWVGYEIYNKLKQCEATKLIVES